MIGGWTTGRLADIAHVISGQSPPSATYNPESRGLPFYQGKADFGARSPVPRTWCDAPLRVAEPGDSLVSVRAPVGDTNLASHRCAIGRGLAAVRAETAWPEFLYFALVAKRDVLRSQGTGAIFASVNRAALESLEIPLPREIAEQRRIAAFLTKLQRRVEIERERARALTALKSATLAKLFREGLRGEPLKDSPIGPIPESWAVVPLGSIGRIGNGSTPKRDAEDFWVGGSIPWVTSGRVHDVLVRTASSYVTPAALKRCHLPLVPPGGILIAITGEGKTLGHCALLEIEACVNQHLAFVVLDDLSAVPEFILAYLDTQYQALRSVASAGGSTKGALTCAYVKTLNVPLPDVGEQRKIGGAFRAMCELKRTAENKASGQQRLFDAVLERLMTGELRLPAEAEEAAEMAHG